MRMEDAGCGFWPGSSFSVKLPLDLVNVLRVKKQNRFSIASWQPTRLSPDICYSKVLSYVQWEMHLCNCTGCSNMNLEVIGGSNHWKRAVFCFQKQWSRKGRRRQG
jgi:hypothetical protein